MRLEEEAFGGGWLEGSGNVSGSSGLGGGGEGDEESWSQEANHGEAL